MEAEPEAILTCAVDENEWSTVTTLNRGEISANVPSINLSTVAPIASSIYLRAHIQST